MRQWIFGLVVASAMLASASSGYAITLRLEVPSPLQMTYAPGDVFDVRLFLDTEGETHLTALFASVYADPGVVAFNDFLSSSPPAVLVNFSTYDALSRVAQPSESPSDPPGFVRAANFVATNPTGSGVAGDNVLLATLSFTVVAPGLIDVFPVLSLPGDEVTVNQVDVTNSVHLVVTPEPGTALLMGLGLLGLGYLERPRR